MQLEHTHTHNINNMYTIYVQGCVCYDKTRVCRLRVACRRRYAAATRTNAREVCAAAEKSSADSFSENLFINVGTHSIRVYTAVLLFQRSNVGVNG